MKKLEKVELSEKKNLFINASALCMVDLLCNRLFEVPNSVKRDEFDIKYDISLFEHFADGQMEGKLTNEEYKNSADECVRRLKC